VNRDQGTKRCNSKGDAFETECRLGENLPCPGGEDPSTKDPQSDAGVIDTPDSTPINLCGNKVVDTGEGCDDGNRENGDGCSANCEPQGSPVTAGTCPGMAVHLWGDRTLEVTATTSAFGNNHYADTACDDETTGLVGNDRVYQVVTHKAGKLIVETANATFDTAIFVRSTCAERSSQVACTAKGFATAGERLEYNVAANAKLFVFIDGGPDMPSGDAVVRFSIQ
jgi:cysteine-rich repeat protein